MKGCKHKEYKKKENILNLRTSKDNLTGSETITEYCSSLNIALPLTRSDDVCIGNGRIKSWAVVWQSHEYSLNFHNVHTISITTHHVYFGVY